MPITHCTLARGARKSAWIVGRATWTMEKSTTSRKAAAITTARMMPVRTPIECCAVALEYLSVSWFPMCLTLRSRERDLDASWPFAGEDSEGARGPASCQRSWMNLRPAYDGFSLPPPHRVARSSARRSHVSRAPVSMPEATMPSRSSRVSNWDVTVTLVLPPTSSKVAVSREMWPGIPSNSNVVTIRSAGTISRISPRNAYSDPSVSRLTYRHLPPFRTSIRSTRVVWARVPQGQLRLPAQVLERHREERLERGVRAHAVVRRGHDVPLGVREAIRHHDPLLRHDLAVHTCAPEVLPVGRAHAAEVFAPDAEVDLADRGVKGLRTPPALDFLRFRPRLPHAIDRRIEHAGDHDLAPLRRPLLWLRSFRLRLLRRHHRFLLILRALGFFAGRSMCSANRSNRSSHITRYRVSQPNAAPNGAAYSCTLCTRPSGATSIRPASSSTRRCLEIAGRLTLCGLASSL